MYVGNLELSVSKPSKLVSPITVDVDGLFKSSKLNLELSASLYGVNFYLPPTLTADSKVSISIVPNFSSFILRYKW
jgi:hypothetical protein